MTASSAGPAAGAHAAGAEEQAPRSETPEVEYLIIGAGVCGLMQLHTLLEIGADVAVVDANEDLGGTWFKNRYPGCRFDSESYTYQYSFSPELLAEWDWSERFSPQPETLSYLNHVADRFDLRRHIRFGARVQKAVWDEKQWLWRVSIADGREITCRFLLSAMGLLSVPTYPRIPGMDEFAGAAFHTFDWPEGFDVAGLRVAVIGTGASGVQVVAEIADRVEQLTVMQRGANWCLPLGNGPITPDEMAELRESYPKIFEWCSETPAGFIHRPDRRLTTDVTREERLKHWEELYWAPGSGLYMGNFRDIMMEEAPNRELTEFVAEKIRQRVDDPRVADLLTPKDHGFGTKRVAGESGFYEVFNRDNVELVDLKSTPITRITPTGVQVQTEDGPRDVEVDVIVYATGFDAVTGPFDAMEIIGTDGLTMQEKWAAGPQTCIGVQVESFPNLFTLVGPHSGSATANFPRGIEDVVTWMTQFARDIEARGVGRVEARREAEIEWVDHVREINSKLLLSKTRSWFNGHNRNVEGHDEPRVLVYLGGAPRYRRRLAEESEGGYPSFRIQTLDETPALVDADAGAGA